MLTVPYSQGKAALAGREIKLIVNKLSDEKIDVKDLNEEINTMLNLNKATPLWWLL